MSLMNSNGQLERYTHLFHHLNDVIRLFYRTIIYKN